MTDMTNTILPVSPNTVIMKGASYVATPSARNCKVCSVPKGSFHKHCKCGTEANSVEKIGVLFGWRRHHKLKTHVMPQSQCFNCRSSKNGQPSKLKKTKTVVPIAVAAIVFNSPELPEVPVVSVLDPVPVPLESVVESVVEAVVDNTPVTVVVTEPRQDGMHVYPIEATVKFDGDLSPLNFGPINIAPNETNTVEGQSMVPDIDERFKMAQDEGVILANALLNAENTWVWGMSGIGKTSGIKQMCALLNRPLYRITTSGDLSLDDFVGSPQVVVDEASGQAVTRFVYGRLIKAMLNGGVLMIDEVTGAPPHVLMALQEVTEPCDNVHEVWKAGKAHATYVCTANEGETIHAAPGFRVVVTDNTNGQGDVQGLFAGTNTMNEAFRSRFSQWYEKTFPTKVVWRQIITGKTGLDTSLASKLVEIAQEVNRGSAALDSKNITNNMIINPRDTLAIARHIKVYGAVSRAFKVGLLNSLHKSDPDRMFLSDLIRNIVGK